MEGTAYALRELKESVDHSEEWRSIRLVGGGAKNDFWAQTLSNVLGVDMVRMESSGAGQGAALLALSASCGQDLTAVAAGVCRKLDSIEKTTGPMSSTTRVLAGICVYLRHSKLSMS